MIALIVATALFGQTEAQFNTNPCSKKSGCYKGKCWVGCAGALADRNGVEWCYVLDWTPNSYRFCTKDTECEKYRCDSCKGACTI